MLCRPWSQVRTTPKGTFVEGTKPKAVNSFDEIDRTMEAGTASRTVAATQMNATSSRAHTIMAITVAQISMEDGRQRPHRQCTYSTRELSPPRSGPAMYLAPFVRKAAGHVFVHSNLAAPQSHALAIAFPLEVYLPKSTCSSVLSSLLFLPMPMFHGPFLAGRKKEISSDMNLIDLAGSERAESTGEKDFPKPPAAQTRRTLPSPPLSASS